MENIGIHYHSKKEYRIYPLLLKAISENKYSESDMWVSILIGLISLTLVLWLQNVLSKNVGSQCTFTWGCKVLFVFLFRSAGACTAAAFLKEFVTHPKWAHLDIAGVMTNKDEVPYLRKGMTGRPTRTLIEFLLRFSQDNAQFRYSKMSSLCLKLDS